MSDVIGPLIVVIVRSGWRSKGPAPTTRTWPARTALSHGVVAWHREERSSRLRATDVRQTIDVVALSWIAMLAQHHHLQCRRVPALRDNLDRLLVADTPSRNSEGRSSALCFYTLDRLSTELLNCAV